MSDKLKIIKLPNNIAVRNLSSKIDIPVGKVIAELIKHGIPASINEEVDFDVASIVLEGLGFQAEKAESTENNSDNSAKLADGQKKRPPIVAVLGHVDHGKTTLLDTIKKSNIVDGESGGITQHISACQIEIEVNKKKEIITFLDTPGHEAFTTLRQRGVNVTDIAILIIAADDGVMPRTVEAIDLIKKSGVPMIVAINKIDKPDANIQRVKQQLAEHEIMLEGWGGDVPVVEVSAKDNIGIPDLLEMIVLVADMKKITANFDIPARGIILDSRLDPKKGNIAVAIILDGVLKKGDAIIVGNTHGKVKKLEDFKGNVIKEAGPSYPVAIMGLKNVAAVGEILTVEGKISRSRIAELIDKKRSMRIGKMKPFTADRILSFSGEEKEFNIILKTDVPGSLEAITEFVNRISIPDVKINVIKSGIGGLTQEDVQMAKSSNAIIFGFNVGANAIVQKTAERDGVVVRVFDIIYELMDGLKEVISQWLGTEIIKVEIGKMKVKALFGKSKTEQVVGGKVASGKVKKGCVVDIFRNKELQGSGVVNEIRSGKQVVQEISEDNECGMKIVSSVDIQEKDELVFGIEEERKRTI